MTLATVPEEQVLHWARNQDLLTITERGVSTDTDTGTFAADSSHLIDESNIKNIRSIVVGGSTLVFGTEYDYDTDYDDSGTIKTNITFTSPQTGAYTITYDAGTDKIFSDYPRDDLTVNSYPRLAVVLQAENSDAFGIGGNTFIENGLFSFVFYGENQDWIRARIRDTRLKLQQSAKNFYNYPFVKPTGRGPIIKSDGRNQVILQGNQDMMAMFKVDSV